MITAEKLKQLKDTIEMGLPLTTEDVSDLIEEVETQQWANRINHEEFLDICEQEGVRPSTCCAPNYCSLAPFHEIKLLREEITKLKSEFLGVPEEDQ